MISLRLIFALTTLLFSSQSGAHAHLVDPPPRSLTDNIKVAPCGVAARTNTPRVLVAGSTVNVKWTETINHPGRFYISFSFANDQNFASNRVKTVLDDKNGGDFSTDIVVPDTLCEDCTMQLIQSMEENPMAPTFYYSCADVNIVAAGTVVPPPGTTPDPGDTDDPDDGSDEPTTGQTKTQVTGCARIDSSGGGPSGPMGPMLFLLLGLPFVLLASLKKTPVKVRSKGSNGYLRSRR